jgi:hypothetical protein
MFLNDTSEMTAFAQRLPEMLRPAVEQRLRPRRQRRAGVSALGRPKRRWQPVRCYFKRRSGRRGIDLSAEAIEMSRRSDTWRGQRRLRMSVEVIFSAVATGSSSDPNLGPGAPGRRHCRWAGADQAQAAKQRYRRVAVLRFCRRRPIRIGKADLHAVTSKPVVLPVAAGTCARPFAGLLRGPAAADFFAGSPETKSTLRWTHFARAASVL